MSEPFHASPQNEVGKTKIEERIFTIRGKQVMIDKDLVLLYGVETKALNQAVKRNIDRFPDDFTEQGAAMLSGVIKSAKAVEVNIKSMRAFVVNLNSSKGRQTSMLTK